MVSFRMFKGKELEWNGSRWELNIKMIKMAQMAKSGSGVDIIYEWSKYDAKIDTICIMFVSKNGEQLCENKVWAKGMRVVKSGIDSDNNVWAISKNWKLC